MTAPTVETLTLACETLAGRDTVLARAFEHVGLPVWRATKPTYQSLARIVVYQLISTKAADAIWRRLVDTLGIVTVESLLAHDPERLLACGLSRPKLKHLQAIAQAVRSGALRLEALHTLSIDDAHQELCQVRGIGPWTANTFLMNAIGHLDAFPHGDVGLLEAYKLLSDENERPSAKAFSGQAEAWRPYRAVAAHLLYDWLNARRNTGSA